MPAMAYAKNYDAELVSTKTAITVEGNTVIENVDHTIKINNRDGDDYTQIKISYDKGEDFSGLEAYILDKNGKVVKKLRKKDIVRMYGSGEDALFQDTYVVSFQLTYDEYPYTLFYSYKLKSENPLGIANWMPLISDGEVPTLKATLQVTIPKNYKMAYRSNKTDTLIKTQVKNGTEYTWKAHYTKILGDETESFAPPLTPFVPYVVVVPLHFKYYGNGSMKSWKAYGNWQDSVLQTLNKLPPNEQFKIDRLLKGVKGKINKIKVLYHYLQDETRYVNVVIKTGRMIPYPASYVANNKYGDCKALANYMKSMLDYAGIKSYCANIYAGRNIQKVDTTFPSPQFNHEIVYIPDSAKPIWLDCTVKTAFGWVGPFIQGRYAMVVQKNDSRLIHTPSLSPKQVENFRKINVSYNLSGDAFLNFKNTYRGTMYQLVNALENSVDPMYKQRYIKKYLVDDGIELLSDSIHQINRDSADIQFYYSGRSGQVYNQYGNNVLVANIPFGVPDIENPKDRKLPLQINYPIYEVDSIQYEIPQGYKLDGIVKDTVLTTQFGKYSHQSYKRESTVYVTNRLLIYRGNYPLKVYSKFYNFLKAANKCENAMTFALKLDNP